MNPSFPRSIRARAWHVEMWFLSLLAILAVGCGKQPEPAGRGTGEQEARTIPTADQIANATYRGLDVAPEVTLTAGEWEGQPFAEGGASRPSATLAPDFKLAGDMNGDGVPEAIVLIATSSGGSGTFLHAAVVGGRGTAAENLGTAPLGDRVQVMHARLVDSRLVLDLVEAGPEDAMCCPSQKATRVFALEPGALKEIAATATGTLSIEDLAGVEWVLKSFAWNQPAPVEPRITLQFDGSRLTGSSGCNRYNGNVSAGEMPGDITIDDRMASTRRACEEEITLLEDRYLKALTAVNKFSFLATRLALTYRQGDSIATLIYAAEPLAVGQGQ